MKLRNIILAFLLPAFILGCSKSANPDATTATDALSANEPDQVAAALTSKMGVVGASIANGLLTGVMLKSKNDVKSFDADPDTFCTTHAEPVQVDDNFTPITNQTDCNSASGSWDTTNSECKMSSSHAEFPGMSAYCFLTKDTGSPDSAQGAFSLYKNVACAFNKAGGTWHATDPGADDTIDLSFDTDCFTEQMLTDVCSDAAGCDMADVSARAILNPDSYYDASLNLLLGDTFFYSKIKVTDGITELAINNNGGGGANQNDAYVAKYDSNENSLSYEGRFDRIDCPTEGNCGWSRHFRFYVDLPASVTDGVAPDAIEAAISNLYYQSNNYFSELVTLRGSMSSGAAGMTGQATKASSSYAQRADAITGSNQAVEVTSCYSTTGTTDGACAGVSVVTIPSGVIPFFLPGSSTYRVSASPSSSQYLDNTVWFESLLGISFTEVDLTSPEP